MEHAPDKAHILLVDDEQEWLDILSLTFADENWNVDTALSGEDALGW